MDLRRQLSLVRRWAWLVVFCAGVAGVAAYVLTGTQPKVFEAKATVLVGQSLTAPNPNYQDVLAAQQLSQIYAQVATTRPILDRVIQAQGLSGTADDLQGRVFAGAPPNSTLFTITAQDSDRERAALIANEVAKQLIAISPANALQVIEPAVAPTTPSAPRVLLTTAMATATGLLLALGFVFAKDYLDDTVRSIQDVEFALGVGPLGVLPQVRRRRKRGKGGLLVLDEPDSQSAEAFRSLRTNLEFASGDVPLRKLLIASAAAGEGRTTTAANLAVAFAQAGRRTLLVDAALRNPGIHRVFKLGNDQGLTTLLQSTDAADEDVLQETGTENLLVLTAGPSVRNPAELLQSQRMKTRLEKWSRTNDLIIIDASPLLGLPDAAILSSLVDGTLLVVWAARTPRGALRQAREVLSRVNAALLGVAINHAAPHSFASSDYEMSLDTIPIRGDQG